MSKTQSYESYSFLEFIPTPKNPESVQVPQDFISWFDFTRIDF
jgi:hypothetical protein